MVNASQIVPSYSDTELSTEREFETIDKRISRRTTS